MSIKNKVQLVGHLGAAPEIKTFNNNGKLARVSIAVSEGYKDQKGEWQNKTYWHNLVAWGYVAERMEKALSKGSHVLIEGKLVSRDYTTDSGEKKYVTEVAVNNFLLFKKETNAAPHLSESTQDYYKISEKDEALPF